MAGDVAKRLLRHPVQAKGQRPGRLVDVVGSFEARWNSLYRAEPRALGLQRLDQSEVFENRGMQRVRQRVHVLAELHQVVTYRTHRPAGNRIAQSLLPMSRIDRKQSQPLGNVIVERVSQPGAFILVSGDQASVQVARFVFGAPTFSDIDRYTMQLSGLAFWSNSIRPRPAIQRTVESGNITRYSVSYWPSPSSAPRIARRTDARSSGCTMCMKSSKWTGFAEYQFPELQSLALARTSSRGMSQTQKRSLAAFAARLMPSSLVRSWACARRSQSRLSSRPTIRIASNPEKPAAARMYHLYCSHSVGSLKLIVLPGGRFALLHSPSLQLRQSNSGSPRFCGGALISPGDVPPRICAATSASFD